MLSKLLFRFIELPVKENNENHYPIFKRDLCFLLICNRLSKNNFFLLILVCLGLLVVFSLFFILCFMSGGFTDFLTLLNNLHEWHHFTYSYFREVIRGFRYDCGLLNMVH